VVATKLPTSGVVASDANQATLPLKPVPLPPVVAGVAPVTGAVSVNRLPATGARLKVKVTVPVAAAYVASAALVAVMVHVPLVAAVRVALAALDESAHVVAEPSATV